DLIEVRSGKKVNIGKFEFKGVETICNIMFNNNINTQVNYTFMDVGNKTAGKPGNKAGATVLYSKDKIKSLLSLDYVGNYFAKDNSVDKIDDYLLLNTKVDYSLFNNTNIFVAIDNITDIEYKILYAGALYTMPTRIINIGIRYTF
ncbi:MAG: hypothetical protein SNJ64_04655, partial [Endomicrobiia bacterium]